MPTAPSLPLTGISNSTAWTPAEIEARSLEHDYVPSLWEERFNMGQVDAILHMLHHLTQGLPGFLRRALLRRASRFPKLHGHFAPYGGKLGLHAEESPEVIGMSECWRLNGKGERERLW